MRAIILFNPDARYLDPAVSSQVESLREKVYATLERYCRQHNENEVSRFAKLLLRLPALRSIGLKCVEQLFFYKLIKVSIVSMKLVVLFKTICLEGYMQLPIASNLSICILGRWS